MSILFIVQKTGCPIIAVTKTRNIISNVSSHMRLGPLHGSQPCCGERAHITQWSYEPCCAGPPKMDGSQWRVLTKCGPLEEGWQTTPVLLPLEPHEKYEKAKRYDTRRWALQVGKYPICYWGRVKTCLLCAKKYIWSLSWRYCHFSLVLLNQKGQQIVGGGGSCSIS